MAAAAAVVLPRVRTAVINPQPSFTAAVSAPHPETDAGLGKSYTGRGTFSSALIPGFRSHVVDPIDGDITTRPEGEGGWDGACQSNVTAGFTAPSEIRYSLVEARVRGSYLMRQSQKLVTTSLKDGAASADGEIVHLPAGRELADRDPWDIDAMTRAHRPSWVISPWPGGSRTVGRGDAGGGEGLNRGGVGDEVVHVRPLQDLNPQYDVIRPRVQGALSFALSNDR